MKTLFTFALTMSLCFSLFAVPSNDALRSLSGVAYSYHKVKITLMEGAGKVKVSIIDENGIKVHSESIEVTDNIVYPLDMSLMPHGKYTVRITNKGGKVDRVIEVKSKSQQFK